MKGRQDFFKVPVGGVHVQAKLRSEQVRRQVLQIGEVVDSRKWYTLQYHSCAHMVEPKGEKPFYKLGTSRLSKNTLKIFLSVERNF